MHGQCSYLWFAVLTDGLGHSELDTDGGMDTNLRNPCRQPHAKAKTIVITGAHHRGDRLHCLDADRKKGYAAPEADTLLLGSFLAKPCLLPVCPSDPSASWLVPK